MQTNAHSDLSMALQYRRQNLGIKNELSTTATEMTTGRTADLVAATGGNLTEILELERRIGLSGAYTTAVRTAQARFGSAQSAVGVLAGLAGDLAADLIAASGRGDPTSRAVLAASASEAFGAAVVALNTSISGQSLFAGVATDTVPVDSAAAILADVSAIVSALPDAATAAAAVAAYFSDPLGGFQSTRYLGSQQPGPQLRVGEAEVLDVLPTALDPAVLSLLAGLALAASVADGAFAGQPAEQDAMLGSGGQAVLAAEGELIDLRATIGQTEGRLADLRQSADIEMTALELLRADIIAVDPFEAASRFEALRGQLEISYLATARLTQLSLAAFLR